MKFKALHPDAYALRPVRVVGDAIRTYTAVTFEPDPWRGCAQMINRCRSLGWLGDADRNVARGVDILNSDGDIVQEFSISRRGFEYLRRTLKFRVDSEA